MNATLTKIAASLAALLISCSAIAGDDRDDRSEREDGDRFSFAMIGDVPYGVAPYSEYPAFDNLVKQVNRQKKLKWVIHTGDIKSGGTECSDDLFYDRLDRYNAFKKPFIYTPGDNEWTDCHRVNAGEYQPLERLAKLREVFFSNPGKTIGGKTMSVETQAWTAGYEEFPENVRWSKNGVIFTALHVVGSNNGLKAFDPASSAVRGDEDDAEAYRRIDAAVDWINETFDKAIEEDAPGVLFMMQANPILEVGYALPRGDALTAAREGFNEILTTLERRTLEYAKPVVLAHGDSHYFRVDKPGLVENGFIGNFTRVENFGSSRVHWVKISVNPKSKQVFKFQPMIIEENL
ncbi:MAG: metallophosphoesterase [Candidatus Thiodiazotropha taylori]|nr:metallophosphoesterase [Candidatus Thiodiazotropha taylori]MCG7924657.1 metallophosphoesterase [Candidatus Thiodiazotropha taylori]MCG7934746.1 metallophosphoesterase [Candidatus Thiodiazotropha taylori]MCG7970934.1 metallophosphoesterase [Candidatus Thiodiazotropha taylori]MCG8073444.1 metallophosphoesterase [Candidatus Thiodiazotropha taylori]